MTYPARSLRLAASVAAAALALAGCGGGNGDDTGAEAGDDAARAEESPTIQPLPSTTVKVPEDAHVTAPGTTLAFGDTATVTHEVRKQGTVLDLTVESAEQGSLKDFTGFDLDDPYKRRGSYFYVRVTVGNAGQERVDGLPVPLWGVSGEDTLLQPVEFKSSFKKCPTQPLPKRFAPGDEFRTCLVFLSPDRGTLAGVSYRPTEDYVPIEWRGKVKPLPAKKAPSGRKNPGGKKDGTSGP